MDAEDSLRRAEMGRALGHDLFISTRWSILTSWPADVCSGFALAQWRGFARRPGDRFVRKWLQLRLSAFSRGLAIDASVTPGLLREIDVERCPVTREPLTHGLCLPTDWSVDRLDNDGAYIVHNLAVMSRRANAAKADLSFDQVCELARQPEPVHGLSPEEWMRLAGLMLGPCHARRPQRAPTLPLLVALPPRTPRTGMQLVQQALASHCQRPTGKNALVRRLRSCLPDERARRGLSLVADAVHQRLKAVDHAADVWLDERAMAALSNWRSQVADAHWARVSALSATLVGARPTSAATTTTWAARPSARSAA